MASKRHKRYKSQEILQGGDGTRDGVESTVYQFTTPADQQEP
jgi:hypothetical protein